MGSSGASSQAGWVRRWIEVVAFVGLWMAAGELLHMSAQVYLLFGIPLTAAFQVLVRRKPIKDLWVRGGPDFSLRSVSYKLAIPLAIVPFYHLVVSVVKAQGISYLLYAVARSYDEKKRHYSASPTKLTQRLKGHHFASQRPVPTRRHA